MQWREKNWANTIIAFNPALLWADVTKYHARVAEICQHVCLCVARERAWVVSERVCVAREWGAVASDGGGVGE